jgi:hypothetical protein
VQKRRHARETCKVRSHSRRLHTTRLDAAALHCRRRCRRHHSRFV